MNIELQMNGLVAKDHEKIGLFVVRPVHKYAFIMQKNMFACFKRVSSDLFVGFQRAIRAAERRLSTAVVSTLRTAQRL